MKISESVSQVLDLLIAGTEQYAREGHGVAPPSVWVFDPRLDPPVLGYATTRPFYKGSDAVRAIERLGAFPAAFGSPVVLVTWELVDLLSALEIDDGQAPTALMTVLADIDGHHQITMHPVEFHAVAQLPSGATSVGVRWGTTLDLRDADLPAPIEGLLATWQHHAADSGQDTATRVCAQMQNEGYQLSLATRTPATDVV